MHKIFGVGQFEILCLRFREWFLLERLMLHFWGLKPLQLGYANFLEGKLKVFDTVLFHGISLKLIDLTFVRKIWDIFGYVRVWLEGSPTSDLEGYLLRNKLTGTEVREAADSISTYPSLDFHVPEPKKKHGGFGVFWWSPGDFGGWKKCWEGSEGYGFSAK